MKSLIHLSQGQLTLLENCPPRFQQIFLDQLGTPLDPKVIETSDWGSRFHQLMQQKELNLSVENVLTQDQQMFNSLEALINANPDIINPVKDTWREAEHRRTLPIDNYLLTVIYDLLIAEKDQAQILDWKTYLQPTNTQKLQGNWQTRLYLYVLAETSEYLPENLTMTYWFVKLPREPQKVTFNYNQELHEQTKQYLTKLLANFTQWLDNYYYNNIDFPHIKDCETKCEFYKRFKSSVASISNHETILNTNWQNRLDQIEEIAL